MVEAVFFRNLTTKGLTAINSGERYFEGYLTVQVKDKQGEVTIVDELMKVLPIWIDRGAPISDTHSNRIIGKGINYAKVVYKDTDGEEYPAIQITGKIHKNYELDNDIWEKIKSGEYKGLSFGGATKADREPMRMKDGSIAYSLKDLEHYEVAVCRDPAVPLALITEFNTLAKAAVDGEDLGGGRMLIKCDKYGCYVEKDNKEAGLKAPEASREALVYDDKTLDQPSETPLENQKKLKKGESDKDTVDELIQETKHPGRRQDLMERHSKYQTGKQDAVVASSEEHARAKKKGEECEFCKAEERDSTIMVKPEDTERQTSLDKHLKEHKRHPSVGKAHKLEHAKELIDDHIEEMKKGEDWSNADGDRHSMYNQDTDEGGMGKKHTGPKGCKCGDPKCKDPKCVKKRDSVLQGYGGEQNETGEVQWTGTGTPYPKVVKGYSDEVKEVGEEAVDWDQQSNEKRAKPKKRKKKAVITNIHSRLKNLDFMLKREGEKKNQLITKPIPDGKGGKGSFQQCINNNQDKHNPGGWCKQIERKVEKRHKKGEGHPTSDEMKDPTYHGEPEEARRGRAKYRKWYKGLQANTASTGDERRERHDKLMRRRVDTGGFNESIEYHRDYDDKGKRRKEPEPHMTVVHPRTDEIMDVDAKTAKESHTGKKWQKPKPEPKTTGKPRFDKRGNPIGPTSWDKEQDEGLEKLGLKEKAIITNIHSRLKNIQSRIEISNWLLRSEDHWDLHEHDKPGKEQQTHNTPNPPKKIIEWDEKLDKLTGEYDPYHWERVEHEEPDESLGGKKINEAKLLESQDKKVKRRIATEGKKRKKKGGFTLNYDKFNEEWDKAKKKKKIKKEGEFGGMNTGEVEWTEPRDTANDRTNRIQQHADDVKENIKRRENVA